MDLISLIVPFLDEKESITNFCEYVDEFSKNKPFEVEIVFVDDGSVDGTGDLINNYSFKHCKTIMLIKLSKNFGSHAAIRAGILHSSGDYAVNFHVDLEEPDDMLDVMYENIKNGLDVVYVERKNVRMSSVSKIFSLMYSALMKRFVSKNYGSGGIGNIMFNRKIIEYLNANIESNSSFTLQIMDVGFKSKTIRMEFRPRFAGKSKWTFAKKMKLFIDSFVAFSFVPIRFVSIIGIVMALVGFLYGLVIIIGSLLGYIEGAGFPTLASLLLFGFGITNISLGIIAEYLWRAYDAARKRPAFLVSDIITLKKSNHEEITTK